jgi:hypothetical protein
MADPQSPLSATDPNLLRLSLCYLEDQISAADLAAFQQQLRADHGRRKIFVRFCLNRAAVIEAASGRAGAAGSQDLVKFPSGTDSDQFLANDLDDAIILPALNIGEDTAESTAADPTFGSVEPANPAHEPSKMPRAAGGTEVRSEPHIMQWLWNWRVAAAITLVSAISLILILRHSSLFGAHPAALAMATSLDAVWADPGSAPTAGNLIKTGVSWTLASGYVEMSSASGLKVVVQGPARFTVEKPGVLSLVSGRLTALVPKDARGFTVNTPIANIVDLGTEFGVAVTLEGQTDVETFRGTVSVTPSAGGTPSASAALITAGIARRVSASGEVGEIPAATDAFIRPGTFDGWNAMPRETPYDRWKAYSERLCKDPDLVAYYTFDEDTAVPEHLTNRASSGDALVGLLGGTAANREYPVWTTGRWPQKGALAFGRNSHQRVEVPVSPGGLLDFSRGDRTAMPFTICAWIRGDDQRPKLSSILLRGEGMAQQFALELYADRTIHGWVGNVPVANRGSPASRTNQDWQHVALIYDPQHGKMELYVNGALVAANTRGPHQLPQSHAPLVIGGRQGNSHSLASFLPPMAGRMDELAIFRRPFSANEIRDMYMAEKPGKD